MPVIEPFVWSVTVRVCAPTVPSDTVNWPCPSANAPDTGVLAAGSLDEIIATSVLGTGFQYWSVAKTST